MESFSHLSRRYLQKVELHSSSVAKHSMTGSSSYLFAVIISTRDGSTFGTEVGVGDDGMSLDDTSLLYCTIGVDCSDIAILSRRVEIDF